MDIKLYDAYETEEGLNLMCYEQTEKYSFLCPFSVNEEGNLELDVMKTLVYSNRSQDEQTLALDKIIMYKRD